MMNLVMNRKLLHERITEKEDEMISIDPLNNSERDNYKLLIGSVIPRPIAFITSLSEDGILNGAPFSYFNVVSSNPPLISLSVQRKAGMMKDTARNIIGHRQFVVHTVDEQNVEAVNETSANLPHDESEIDRGDFLHVHSEKIVVPGVRGAKIRMECVLEKHLELGSDGAVGCDHFIGKVVRFHVDKDIYDEGRIDPNALAAVSRLAGANYAKLGEIFEIERPD